METLLKLQSIIANNSYVLTLFVFVVGVMSIYWLFKSHQHVNIDSSVDFDIIKITSKNIYESNNPIFVMMEIIKNHSKYKIIQHRKPLTSHELIGLILYTYSRGYCRKMKESRNEWYHDAINAVDKIYSVLHYKSDKRQPKVLFHGSENPLLDQFSKEELFLKTFCSFTTEFSVAQKFATGSILVITGADEKLRCGELKGADVSWISPYEEEEWIILPTTFHKWREMSKQEIADHGWKIKPGIKVYITSHYESSGHLVSSNCRTIDNDLQNCKAIKDWVNNELGLNKTHSMKYFNLFIENGYDTLELMKGIERVDDLKEIGIVKIGHIKTIVKKIKELDEYLKIKQNARLQEIINYVGQTENTPMMRNSISFRCKRKIICKCGWIHHDTIPINQFAPICEEDRQHIAKFHPNLHYRLLNQNLGANAK